MIIALNNGTLPIKQITEVKIEAQVTGGIATIKQKRAVIVGELALSASVNATGNQNDGVIFQAGSKVFLVPDAAHQPWNKTVYSLNGIDFVLVPLGAVLAVDVPEMQPDAHSN